MTTLLTTLLIGIFFGFILFYLLHSFWRRKKYSWTAEKALFAEKEAEDLLKREGFEILGKQVRENVITYVDGKAHLGYVQADYLVKKKGRAYVAEVKSGETASDPTEPSTRRQLLEYDYVFKPDGLLLVDMQEKKIHAVEFKFPKERNLSFYFQFFFALFILAVVIGIIWLMVFLRLF